MYITVIIKLNLFAVKFCLQEDYKLLEAMNLATITKYSDMKQIVGNINKNLADLKEKCQLFLI